MSKSKGGRGSALRIPMRCSSELREFTGEKKISRGEAMKVIWKYIKKHKLQDKKDKRVIRSDKDKKLAAILGKKKLTMFEIGGKLSDHLSKD